MTWKPPHPEWVKCNTDGACKGNPSKSYYGFCIRDTQGDLLYVEANNIGVGNNILAEAKAIREALIYSTSHGFQLLVLETDSLSLRNILVKNWKIPWEIVELVEYIFIMMEEYNVQIKHRFREANQLADYIADTTVQTEVK